MIAFGILSAFLALLINQVWKKGTISKSLLAGVAGALVGGATFAWDLSAGSGVEVRGGYVPTALIVPLLCIALLGNFYEEVLFRGYLQGYMENYLSPLRSAIGSGIVFSFGHVFLALTVTNTGPALLVFALYEGIIAGTVRMKYGVIPATLTHGLAIFVLASGI